jgi:hypothetical protein
MNQPLRIGIIGDFNPNNHTHLVTAKNRVNYYLTTPVLFLQQPKRLLLYGIKIRSKLNTSQVTRIPKKKLG